MNDTDYFSHPALDQTMLKLFRKSPREYAYRMLHKSEPNAPALEFGKAAHSIVLGKGPEVMPSPDRRTKAGRELAASIETMDEPPVMLRQADYERLMDMMANKPDRNVFGEGQPEMALFATDPDTGVELKGKADWLPSEPDSDGILRIRDYKTTIAPLDDFPRTSYTHGYHIQAAFYMRLMRLNGYETPLGFEFIVQSKNPSYDWKTYRFDEMAPELQMADQIISQTLESYARWQARPLTEWLEWGADKTPQPIEYTDWQLLDMETDIDSWTR